MFWHYGIKTQNFSWIGNHLTGGFFFQFVMLLQWQATITYLAKFGNIQNTEVENSTAAMF
jgi:hypothetical protein